MLGKITASGNYILSLAAAGDGSETSAVVLAEDVDASSDPKRATVIVECAGVDKDKLVVGTGHDADSVVEPLPGTRRAWMRGSVAVLPVMGVITPYATLFSEISGATSIDVLAQDYAVAMSSREIKAILLQIDSPGGAVTGVNEFAAQLFANRDQKPTEAYIAGAGESAAYWIATGAGRVWLDATARAGSIGVRMLLRKADRPNEFEVVSSQSPLKNLDPATDAGRHALQRRADALAGVFIAAVANHRGVDQSRVETDFGQGDSLIGQAAADAGMADGLSSLETVIARLADTSKQSASTAASRPAATSTTPSATADTPTTRTDPVESALTQPPSRAGNDGLKNAIRAAMRTAIRGRPETPVASSGTQPATPQTSANPLRAGRGDSSLNDAEQRRQAVVAGISAGIAKAQGRRAPAASHQGK